ncbi:hypothetical protein O181_002204 [Austropuccinia psidii MF-1]|uniref:Uncharacterized protein n=1 Tax=Austropuccinia psidii MF-1 TaxID=1389203 RepID=A0A9Q3GCM3_9BASI|nr:hypothetical protein [Austropuccinia psidii MF-1]
MSPVHLRDLGISRNQPEKREELFKFRRSGFLQNGKWQETQEDHAHTTIPLLIQQRPQARGLVRNGSITSAPLNTQRSLAMEHGKQEFQHSSTLGRTWGNLPEDMLKRVIFQRPYGNHQRLEYQQGIQTLRREGGQNKGESSHNTGYRRAIHVERTYSDSFRLKRSRPTQLSSGFTPPRIQKSSQRKEEADPMIQKLLDLVKEVHRNNKL